MRAQDLGATDLRRQYSVARGPGLERGEHHVCRILPNAIRTGAVGDPIATCRHVNTILAQRLSLAHSSQVRGAGRFSEY